MFREDVQHDIEEIRNQLWAGHASLMVGAGFSKNAELRSKDASFPPTWDELKKAMADRIYEDLDKDEREKTCNSKEVTRIAFEFQNRFDRPELDRFLEGQIRDRDLLPGELHKSLLELPWKDVFTTNYDTLLERAAKGLFSRTYSLVTAPRDLAHDTPRLIKLHGTICPEDRADDDMPLIVTEEDYRKYASDHALFAQTLRQAIATTNLCLIGFSGKDYNFLGASGWVRDILGKDCPTIYMIDKWDKEPPLSERKTMEALGIKRVDLGSWKKGKDHKELLQEFLRELFRKPEYDGSSEVNLKLMSPSVEAIKNNEKRREEFSALLLEWKKQREKYSRRFVLPPVERKNIVLYTERWVMIPRFCTELPAGKDIRGLFEYNWRMEHCLIPIQEEDIPHYETIVKRHNPFRIEGEGFFRENAFTAEDDDPERESVQICWIELMFAILRWKRENLVAEDFAKYKSILEKVVKPLSDHGMRLLYERALFAMSSPDFEELTRVMDQWKRTPSSPEWDLKLASIIAELGDFNATWKTLKQTLLEIRKHKSDCDDLYFMGLEGVALAGVDQCRRGSALLQRLEASGSAPDLPNETIIKERLKVLNSQGCNPFYDMERFQLALSNPPKEPVDHRQETRVFDRTVVTISTGYGWEPEAVKGYQFVRYLEETGLLQHLDFIGFVDKPLIQAIKRIVRYSYWLAFAAFNRIGSKEEGDYDLFLSQGILDGITGTQVDETASHYIREVRWLIENARDKLSELFNNFYKKTFVTLLEFISRLIVKATPEVQQKALDLMIDLYSCPIDRFGAGTQIRNCMKRLSEAMPADLICRNLEKLLHLDPPREPNASFWYNPFEHIALHKSDMTKIRDRDAISSRLDAMLDYLDSGTDWQRRKALNTLFVFYDLGFMNETQIQRFAKGLFSKLNDHGLPALTDLCLWVFSKIARHLESPRTVNDNLLRFYSGYGFNIQDSSFPDICYSLLTNLSVTNGNPNVRLEASDQDIQAIYDHVRASVLQFVERYSDNKNDFFNLFFESPASRLLQLDRIVAEIIIPRTNNESKRSQIMAFLQQAETIQPFPSSRCALLQKDEAFPEDLAQELIVAISSADRDMFNLYSWALLNLYIRAENGTGPIVPAKIFHSLLDALGMKSNETFKLACGTLTAILDHYDMDPQELNLVLRHLELLEPETRFSKKDSRFPYKTRFDDRVAAGGLAARVYRIFVERGEAELPEPLRQWRDICHSSDEYPGLRNKWAETVNRAEDQDDLTTPTET